MSAETAVTAVSSLPAKPEGPCGRPSMFHSSKQFIEAGDLVILHQTRDNLLAITVTPGQFHHSKWGRYGHDDMIGMRFGSRMASPAPHAGFIHLLRPTPSLWSLSLPHRTQIVYLPDISFIMNELRIRPGSRIIEAGTGSGSMSHSLGMTVGGDVGSAAVGQGKAKGKGRLFTFEYHATRFEKAREEFAEHGLEDIVQLEHRNVCKDGFGTGPSRIDAVFLDLPAPWEAIPHTLKYLRDDVSTRICSFSPCIEQVTKTVQALDANGFTHIEMYEVLIRPHEVVQTPPTLVSIETISSRLKRQEVKRESRRQIQMEMARKRNAKLKEQEEAGKAGGAMQVDVEDAEEQAAAGSAAAEGKRARSDLPEEGRDTKRRRTGDADLTGTHSDEASQTKRAKYDDRRQEEEDEDISAGVSSSWNIERTNWVTRVVPEVRGHTSYLTFATMFPRSVREAIDKREQEKKNRVMVRTAELAGIPTEGGLAKTVAMRAVAGMSSAGSQASSTAGSMGSLPGSVDRTITREESFDTQASDGYERVFASMTEEDFAALP